MGYPSSLVVTLNILLLPGSEADQACSRSSMSVAYSWKGRVLASLPGKNSIGSSGENGIKGHSVRCEQL